MASVMKTLLLNPPSFKNFDGGASSRWPATREIASYWYPVWLSYPAGMLPGSRLLDAPPHGITPEQTVEIDVERQYQHLRELDAAREVARLELKLAQENVQIVQASFGEGRSNLRDMEKARLEENDKWLAFLDSDYEHQKAQLDLLNTTGDLGRLFR